MANIIKKIFPGVKVTNNEIKGNNYNYTFRPIDDYLEVSVLYIYKSIDWRFDFTIDKNINIKFINGEVSMYNTYISVSPSVFWNIFIYNEDDQEINESIISIMKPFISAYKNRVLYA